MRPRGHLPEGFVLNHTYEILRLIGSGGMGDVYEARNLLSQDLNAIKVIKSDLVDDERVRAMFLRESEILKRIRNDAVVNYEGLLQDEHGRAFLVMDFIDGPSLRDRLREKPLSADEGERLLRRLAKGLAEVHAAGTLHRDLSPDNVLLPGGDLDRAAIIDFGIAKLDAPDAKTLIGTDIAGKYGYISPEQLGVIDHPVEVRSEVYSLALVIAAALRGSPVDMGTSWGSVVEARKQIPDLEGCPKALRGPLELMLQPNPKDRPADMEAVLDLLGSKGRKASAPRRAGASRRRETKENRGGGLKRVAVVLIVLAGLGGIGYAGYQFAISPTQLVDTMPSLESPMDDEEGQDPMASDGTRQDEPSQDPTMEPPTEAPVETPLEPAPEADGVDVAALQRLIEAAPCSSIVETVSDDGIVTVIGEVGSVETKNVLDRNIRNFPGVTGYDDQTAVTPQPACEATALLGPFMDPASLPMQFNETDLVYQDGDRLIILISNASAQDRHIQVDFFDPGGEVFHLRPNPVRTDTLLPADAVTQIGAGPDQTISDRTYSLSAPYGTATVLVTSTLEPLFLEPRPEAELATDYLTALRAAISDPAIGPVIANWTTVEITP